MTATILLLGVRIPVVADLLGADMTFAVFATFDILSRYLRSVPMEGMIVGQ